MYVFSCVSLKLCKNDPSVQNLLSRNSQGLRKECGGGFVRREKGEGEMFTVPKIVTDNRKDTNLKCI